MTVTTICIVSLSIKKKIVDNMLFFLFDNNWIVGAVGVYNDKLDKRTCIFFILLNLLKKKIYWLDVAQLIYTKHQTHRMKLSQ